MDASFMLLMCSPTYIASIRGETKAKLSSKLGRSTPRAARLLYTSTYLARRWSFEWEYKGMVFPPLRENARSSSSSESTGSLPPSHVVPRSLLFHDVPFRMILFPAALEPPDQTSFDAITGR